MAAHRLNPADYLKEYNIPELERIAQEQYDSWGDGFNIPVDIDYVLENLPDVSLFCFPGLKLRYGIEGMAGMDDDQLIIYIDGKLMDLDSNRNRCSMTIAEEIAHVILHRKAIENVRTPEDFIALHRSPSWKNCERNAKWLAAALLMPSAHLINDSQKMYSNCIEKIPVGHKFGSPEYLKKIIASKLADRYEVSQISMTIRLEKWPLKVMEKIDDAMKNELTFLS